MLAATYCSQHPSACSGKIKNGRWNSWNKKDICEVYRYEQNFLVANLPVQFAVLRLNGWHWSLVYQVSNFKSYNGKY